MKMLALCILLAGCTSATEPVPQKPQCGTMIFHDGVQTMRAPYCATVK